MSLITALKELVFGHDDTQIMQSNGRVYCPWHEADQDIDRCFECPMFEGIKEDSLSCSFRKRMVYHNFR